MTRGEVRGRHWRAPALTRPAADLSRGERCGMALARRPSPGLRPSSLPGGEVGALEALNRDTMAEITMRGESMRSEHPLRE